MMKIRNGFVTNSSSSSFILTKQSFCTNSLTVQQVYDKIKDLYEEYHNRYADVLKRVLKEHGKDFYTTYRDKYGTKEFDDTFRKKYGVSIYDLSYYARHMEGFQQWRHCKTYKDYIRVVTSNTSRRDIYPFEIIDYRECKNIADNWALIGTISWYDHVSGKAHTDIEMHEEESEDTKYRKELLKLGDIGIHSECGYIPDEIVDKLVILSAHCCNHMG